MSKIKRMVERDDGWTEDVLPDMGRYRLACCDCGLVHDMKFVAVRITETYGDGSFKYEELDKGEYRVAFKARRNNRSTAAMRRKPKP